jgi:siroheme synthase
MGLTRREAHHLPDRQPRACESVDGLTHSSFHYKTRSRFPRAMRTLTIYVAAARSAPFACPLLSSQCSSDTERLVTRAGGTYSDEISVTLVSDIW